MEKFPDCFDFLEPNKNEVESAEVNVRDSKVYAAFRLSKYFKIRIEISIFGRPFYVRTLNPLSKLKIEEDGR